jgi:hypothetical protein
MAHPHETRPAPPPGVEHFQDAPLPRAVEKLRRIGDGFPFEAQPQSDGLVAVLRAVAADDSV